MPALALLLCWYLHGIQEPSDGVGADALAIHLLDGGNDALLALVVDCLAADPLFAVGIPSRTAIVRCLSQRNVVFQQ